MATFFIRTRRMCTRRNADSQKIYDFMVANGWAFTPNLSAADAVILCTCAAMDSSENQTLLNLKDMLEKKKPTARLIITGCMPKIDPDRLAQLGSFEVVNPKSLEDFDSLFGAKVSIKDVPENGVIVVPDFLPTPASAKERLKRWVAELRCGPSFFRHRVAKLKQQFKKVPALPPSFDIRISEGCLGTCSYCGIKFAIGQLESRPMEGIMAQLRNGLEKGYKRIRFVASDTGCYGLDVGLTFPALLKGSLATEGDYVLEIVDFNPQWLIRFYDPLTEVLRAHPRKVTEMVIPVQSGSNRILKLMRRPYDIDVVKDTLTRFHREFPRIRITTHFIVGFPGETRDEFKQSKRFAAELDFIEGAVFEYCDRPNTDASRMSGKTPKHVIVKRFADLGLVLDNRHPQ